MRPSFEEAKRRYVHRFTMDHLPRWATVPTDNGKFYAPQYRSDAEWYANTKFPGEPGGPSRRDKHCESSKQTWPLGNWLEQPYNPKLKGWLLIDA